MRFYQADSLGTLAFYHPALDWPQYITGLISHS